MVKSDDDDNFDPVAHINLVGLKSISSIGQVLPLPDSIEPEIKLDEHCNDDDDDDIEAIIAALGKVTNRFELDDHADRRQLDRVKAPLVQAVLRGGGDAIFRGNSTLSTAKQIQDEKLAKKEKKKKEKMENGVKQKKHKKHHSNDEHEKERKRAKLARREEREKKRALKRQRKDDAMEMDEDDDHDEHETKVARRNTSIDDPNDPKFSCSVKLYNLSLDDVEDIRDQYREKARAKKVAEAERLKKKQHKDMVNQLHERMVDEDIQNCTKRFRNLVETALTRYNDAELGSMDTESSDLLLEEFQLKNISNEAAKLKKINAIKDMKKKRLSRMCQLMEVNMRQGCRISLFGKEGDSRQERIAKVNCALEAGLAVMYVLTAPDVSTALISDNVIERTIELVRFQLTHSIYPEFDPVYRSTHKVKSDKQKRAQNKITNHSSSVLRLFTRVADLLALIGELAGRVTLIDSMIIKIANIAISPFFVENIQKIQLSAIKCATVIFSKYGEHRRSLLDDILSSLARLPTTKRNLRNYRLSHLQDETGDESDVICIQMISALVLQLVQSVAKIPPPINTDLRRSALGESGPDESVDENQILTTLDLSLQISTLFLTIFLDKIQGRKEEIDYRPLFENFIQDLLSTVNKPEWPASGEMLTVLGKMLVRNFLARKIDISLRTASLEYLGVVAARLRKDAVTSEADVADVQPLVDIVDHGVEREENEDDRQLLRRQLQTIVVQHLNAGKKVDTALDFSLNFSIAQWVKDLANEQAGISAEEVESLRIKRAHIHKMINHPPGKELELSYDDICIISRYLSKDRQFNKSFDTYLLQILSVSNEPAVQVRTKTLKCLTEIVSVDPNILSKEVVSRSIHRRMQDVATSVREAAVDLIGKFILTRPEVANQYYPMLTERILDTGVSVRKRVIKILRDLCLEVKDFPYIGNACIRIIKRVNDDEEGIKKLVLEVFSKLWFTPVDEDDVNYKALLDTKAATVMDVVAVCPDVEWLQDLMKGLIDNNDQAICAGAVSSCRQLGECISARILARNSAIDAKHRVACFTTLLLIANVRPELIADYIKVLHPYLNIKIKTASDKHVVIKTEKILERTIPLMKHPPIEWLRLLEMDLMKLVMFAPNEAVEGAISCLGSLVNKVSKKYNIVWECFIKYYGFLKRIVDADNVEETMRQPSKKIIFLRSIQTIGYLHKTFDFDQKEIVEAKKININIKEETYEKLLSLVPIEMLELQTNVLASLGHLMVQEPSFMLLEMTKALYDGVLTSDNDKLRHVVLQNFDNYLKAEDQKLSDMEKANAKAMAAAKAAAEAAKNEPNGFDKEHQPKVEVKVNLKQMQDVRSSQASAVIQLFLRQIQDAYVSNDTAVRRSCLGVIIKVQNQGLVAPLGLLHTLIAASADPKIASLRTQADHVMHEINKRQAVIHVAALKGLREAFKVSRAVAGGVALADEEDTVTAHYAEQVPRGYLVGEYGKTASCCHLYSLLKDKKHKRNFVQQLLSTFDDQHIQLDYLLYVADNLAWFPHSATEEVLYIIKIADTKINGTGNDVLHTFKSQMKPLPNKSNTSIDTSMHVDAGGDVSMDSSKVDSDSENEDPDNLDVIDRIIDRLPEAEADINDFLTRSLAIFMLLRLRIYLKQAYNLSDKRIEAYAKEQTNDQIKAKQCVRKTGPLFEPVEVLKFLNNYDREDSNYDSRLETVKIYLKLKQLMIEIDDVDESSDEEGNKIAKAKGNSITAKLEMEAKQLQRMNRDQDHHHHHHQQQQQHQKTPQKKDKDIEDDSDRDTDGEEKKVDTLDRMRNQIHKKKDKKKKHQRRRARIEDSDSSDSWM